MTTDFDPLTRAFQLHQAGNLAQARDLYCQVIAANPCNADAWHLLGTVLHQTGHHETACDCIEKAIAERPADPNFYVNYGSVLTALGQYSKAVTILRCALELDANVPEAHNNLGNALRALRHFDESLQCYRCAIDARPEYAEAFNNRGLTLIDLKRFDEAAESIRKCLALRPDSAAAWLNLAVVLDEQGKPADAVACLEAAIERNPRLSEAHFNLGNSLLRQFRPVEAARHYHRAVEIRPDFAGAQSNLLFCLNYIPELTPREVFQAHRAWGDTLRDRVTSITSHRNAPAANRRLRVGYVSPDLREHPVPRFFEPILIHHDRQQFDVVCYVDVRKPDSVTERLKNISPGWRWTCELNDEQLCQQIEADEIDVLVDLAGHTANNRLGVFARKPAPIQVTYLGYPNTTGLRTIDYKITDAVLDPPDQPAWNTEKLVRLDCGVCCFMPPAHASAVATRPLPAGGHVTFGSLHRLEKLSEPVFDLWGQVLLSVPNARLLVFWPTLTGERRDHIARQITSRGVASERLELHCDPGPAGYLDVYHKIDIGLDVFPWTGGTTTCEALWMGVPVVALCGSRHAARGTASVLDCVGLRDLIAHSPDEYVRLAAGLARNPTRLAALRHNMRDCMRATICDGRRFTAALEAAYRTMWQTWCAETEKHAASAA